MRLRHSLVAVVCVSLLGCQLRSGTPNVSSAAAPSASTRDNAYSLLFQLLNQEKDVSKLLVVKRDSRELNRLIKEISTVSGDAVDQLKKLRAQDRSLKLDAINLPPAETATREAIAATKTKELLGVSGDTFERALL